MFEKFMRYDYHGILKLFFPHALLKISTPSYYLQAPIWLFVNKRYLKAILAALRLSSLFARTTAIDITGFERGSSPAMKSYLNYVLSLFILPLWNLKLGVVTVLHSHQHLQPSSRFFPGLIWPEREISEMLGINFSRKLDARRLLLDYTFEGLPLTKGFPTIGFEEIEYDARERWLIYKPLKMRDEISL